MFAKSIRWRMQLWLAFLLVCILSGFGVTAFQLHRTNQLSQIDEELERRVAALSGDTRGRPPFGPPPGRPPLPLGGETNAPLPDFGHPPGRPPFEPDRDGPFGRQPGMEFGGRRGGPGEWFDARAINLSSRTAGLFDEGATNSYYYAIWSRSGSVLKRSTNAPTTLGLPERADALSAVQQRTVADRREAFQFTEMGECVVVGRSIAADLAAVNRFAWWLAAAGAGVLALGLGGGAVLTKRALRPLADISAAASRISVGTLAERIDVAETDSELGRLAGVLNSTFARLAAAFAQQKQFTADASHELRTPIAVIIAEAQATLARERTAAEYRETVEACLDAAQQMRQLTQSLLELARYDAGQEMLERVPVDLAQQTASCVGLIRPLARARGIQIHCDLGPAQVLGDGDRLGQVVVNLLTNAVAYNRDQGEIRVTARTDSSVVMLTVADTGPGIAAEDLPRVFERFYRGDRSRARAEGRSGLGLAICQAIVEAHGGSIRVASPPGAGATFTVELPAA